MTHPSILVFCNVSQPPFSNNLLGAVRAFQRAASTTLVEPHLLDGFVSTGGAAPAPLPVSAAASIKECAPDLVVCLAGGLFLPDDLTALLPTHTLLIGFALSDPLGMEASLEIAPRFDLFYTQDPSSAPVYRQHGIEVRECLPAIDGDLFFPLPSAKKTDVFFAGRWTPYRDEVVRSLHECCSVAVHQHVGETRWSIPTRPVLDTPKVLCAALNRASMCLEFAVIDNAGPPLSGWWRMTNRPQFAAACSVPSLIEENPLVGRYFEPGAEIFTYRRVEDLLMTVRRLLDHPERLKVAGARARARIISEHLWGHRVERVLSDAQRCWSDAG